MMKMRTESNQVDYAFFSIMSIIIFFISCYPTFPYSCVGIPGKLNAIYDLSCLLLSYPID
jgi:hypothetical protein